MDDRIAQQVQTLFSEIVTPTAVTESHNQWIKRELVKLLHKEVDLAKREQSFKQQEKKKSQAKINHHVTSPVPETPPG